MRQVTVCCHIRSVSSIVLLLAGTILAQTVAQLTTAGTPLAAYPLIERGSVAGPVKANVAATPWRSVSSMFRPHPAWSYATIDPETVYERDYGHLPLQFEPNLGQADKGARFLMRGHGMTMFLTDSEAVMVVSSSEERVRGPRPPDFVPAEARRAVVRMKLLGAAKPQEVTGVEKLPGVSNYFIGKDPAKWRTGIPNYARVQYKNVYPGVDLVYYGHQGQLEYDFVVQPGADPSDIKLAFQGADDVEAEGGGGLVIRAKGFTLRHRTPVVYQEIAGKRVEVKGRFKSVSEQVFGFEVESWNRNYALVIDPTLIYSTFLGGSGDTDTELGMAVDSAGRAYVAGYTNSVDFPITAGALQTTAGGDLDGYVARINASGTALEYSTYLGGSGQDLAIRIRIDPAGNAYLAGTTASPDFPTTPGAYEQSNVFGSALFLAKLNSSGGQLIWSTLVGESWPHYLVGLAIDSSGNVYASGPTTGQFPTTAGAYQTAYAGGLWDAYVVKMNSTGSALVWSTLLGGSDLDDAQAITVDASGNVYVGGGSASHNFPTTPGAFQTVVPGPNGGAFVSKFDPTGTLLYSTYLDGSAGSTLYAITVDPSGNAYITGYTISSDYPVTQGAFQTTFGGGISDVYVSKLNATGTALLAATYLGGSEEEDPSDDIVLDAAGNVYVSGATASSNFPTTSGAIQGALAGNSDVFFAKLNSSLSTLLYSTYLGGPGEDAGFSVGLTPRAASS